MGETTKYSIIIRMCQGVNEIDGYSVILQVCLLHKINAELITVSGQWHFCGIFGTLEDIRTKRLSCSFCECKGPSKAVIQMCVGGLGLICQGPETH